MIESTRYGFWVLMMNIWSFLRFVLCVDWEMICFLSTIIM